MSNTMNWERTVSWAFCIFDLSCTTGEACIVEDSYWWTHLDDWKKSIKFSWCMRDNIQNIFDELYYKGGTIVGPTS